MNPADLSQLDANAILPTVVALEGELGANWLAMRESRARTTRLWDQLETALDGMCSSDVSVVLFGSIARGEVTTCSDADWEFLVDGQADPNHADAAQRIGRRIDSIVGKGPGAEGVFGNMAFSHDLIQLIGGEDDTNKNLTRRNLLLLESRPFGNGEAHQRTVEQVLNRYIAEDLDHAGIDREYYVPRFLLNDFARFWRTMAVDFAYKRKGRHGRGIALRNVKLRMSRKLLFASGLIGCFACELGLSENICRQAPRSPVANRCQGCLLPFFTKPPLENLARAFIHFLRKAPNRDQRDKVSATARKALDAYDQFLGLLSDDSRRKHLEDLAAGDLDNDSVFRSARAISRQFRDALQELFFTTDEKIDQVVDEVRSLLMRSFGFSTGALALGEFVRGFSMAATVAGTGRAVVELSALREVELLPLLDALPMLDLSRFDYVSIHAPSHFDAASEAFVADALLRRTGALNVVLHPDAISDFGCWRPFGARLCIENMDKRKPVGRNCLELAAQFKELPDAGFCLDLGHSRQIDPTMAETLKMLRRFGSRLRQVHLSEVTTTCRHESLSLTAILAFRAVAPMLPEEVPVIIESVLGKSPTLDQLSDELVRADYALPSRAGVSSATKQWRVPPILAQL